MKFLFLYSEISEYFLACCNELAQYGEVHIVRWPVNKEAPFHFKDSSHIKLYSKNDYNLNELKTLIASIQPSIIVCSGWIDKEYLKITRHYYGVIPTIMTCDTHWRGNFKQHIATIISRFTLLKIFSHAWIPGKIQEKYVSKLGFKNSQIKEGFYSCDINHFESIYQLQKEQKQSHFPKRFLYVGRYYEFKGIKELWNAFIELQNEEPNEWELWCLGTGDIEPINHPKIKHFGFVQPKDLANYTSQTGVFILPSRFEPWGVVVHEFATCGFPLLLSNEVGSSEMFLEDGKNGYSFKANDIYSLKEAMKKIIRKAPNELIEMGKISNQLAHQISPKTWAKTILDIINLQPSIKLKT